MAKVYYNGVLLPEIPSDVLAKYPICLIYLKADGTNYRLLAGTKIWYVSNGIYIESSTYVVYTATLSSDAWVYETQYTDDGNFGLGNGIKWSNHTIPDGSSTSTTAYFPKCGVCQYTTKKLDYNGVTLPSIPTEHFATHPFVGIRKNLLSGYYDLCMDTAQWYYNNNNGIDPTASTTQYWYRIPIATAGACTEWEFYEETTGGCTIDESRVVLWSLQDISNGKNSTTVYFNGTSPVVDLSITKYLVRNNDTIYTVTDGSLVEVSGEINSNLFIDNGVDDIPSGTLLMTLSKPELLCWEDTEKDLPKLTATVTATPVGQYITKVIDMSNASISGINNVTVECTGTPWFSCSFDGGITWMEYNGGTWIEVELYGMAKETLISITSDEWYLATSGIDRFIMRVLLRSSSDSLTNLSVNFLNVTT